MATSSFFDQPPTAHRPTHRSVLAPEGAARAATTVIHGLRGSPLARVHDTTATGLPRCQPDRAVAQTDHMRVRLVGSEASRGRAVSLRYVDEQRQYCSRAGSNVTMCSWTRCATRRIRSAWSAVVTVVR